MPGDEKSVELDIKILPDDAGVEVNGEWYSSLQSYYEKREEKLKEESGR